MHLKHDIVRPLAEQYGSDRIAFVLANTLQQESWDGRFLRDNKAWAAEDYIPENIVHGIDMNRELIVSSHPVVLDGFINMFRREVRGSLKILKQHEVEASHLGKYFPDYFGDKKLTVFFKTLIIKLRVQL